MKRRQRRTIRRRGKDPSSNGSRLPDGNSLPLSVSSSCSPPPCFASI
uniref:Uncharacterized protein n=1 Tax=Rhizophora mucronata TaxID=61149 RepID=A0A2P2QF07_RHIMU